MAAALLHHHAAGAAHVRSAGSTPADEINPALPTVADDRKPTQTAYAGVPPRPTLDSEYVFGYRVGGHAEDPAGIAGRVF
jgi:hypothetical protein